MDIALAFISVGPSLLSFHPVLYGPVLQLSFCHSSSTKWSCRLQHHRAFSHRTLRQVPHPPRNWRAGIFKNNSLSLLSVHWCFACMYVYMSVRSWSYRQLWAVVWVSADPSLQTLQQTFLYCPAVVSLQTAFHSSLCKLLHLEIHVHEKKRLRLLWRLHTFERRNDSVSPDGHNVYLLTDLC